MMKVSCKDVGMDCPFEASADEGEELVKKMKDHAMMSHGDKVEGVSDEDFKKMIMEKAREE